MIETISKKDSFIIYKSFFEPISSLSFSDRGLLFTAIFEYQINQKIIDMPPQVKMAFMFFKNQFDLDFVKWEKTCLKRSNAGKQGGRPSESKTKQKKQMLFKKAKEAENENENENENVLSKDNNKKNITKKETSIDENFMPNETSLNVAKEENFTNETLNRELAKFIDYWKSNGKRKKDWQATFRNWLRNNKDFCGNKSTGKRQEPKSDVEIYAEIAAEIENKDGFHREWSGF